MDEIVQKSNILVQNQPVNFVRSLTTKIDWVDRLIGIVGARGTGKTTLLLQRLKQHYGLGQHALYVTLDDIYFTEHKLTEVAKEFLQYGGKAIFIDEVHSYPHWAKEIKNIYDTYPDLKIVFTGSSIINILNQNADLSRRAIQYELTGLSFREYLAFTGVQSLDSITLHDLLKNHIDIAAALSGKFKPLPLFKKYLREGYYPFFAENPRTYPIRIEQLTKLIIEHDLRFMEGFDLSNSRKIYQLLYILSTNVPFKPNVSKLSEKIGIHRNTLTQYIHYLDKARLINILSATGKSISTLQKPDKLFLENTNLNFALAPNNTDRGTLRESFFMNQLLNAKHKISLPPQADFFIDNKITVEIGGKDKQAQPQQKSDFYIAADDLEIGAFNKIPLWLFGFLY